MSRYLPFLLIALVACPQASDNLISNQAPIPLCSDSWYRTIEEKVPTSDAQMHGPEIGSEEWKSVIEFKLGRRKAHHTLAIG